jgi:hypothetical protein
MSGIMGLKGMLRRPYGNNELVYFPNFYSGRGASQNFPRSEWLDDVGHELSLAHVL